MTSRIWFGVFPLWVILLPPSYEHSTCNIMDIQRRGQMTAEEITRTLTVRNVFQCKSACRKDSNCKSVRYDYMTRLCELSKIDYNVEIEQREFTYLSGHLCRIAESGPCSCAVRSRCALTAYTYMCLKMGSRYTVVDCGAPNTVPNGYVNVSATTLDSVGDVICNIGYNYSQPNTSIACTSVGQWEPVTGSCDAVDCGYPNEIQHGYLNYNTTTFDSISSLMYDVGYSFNGLDNMATCNSDGQWTGINGSCGIMDCGAPAEIKNGWVIYNLTTYGSLIHITCDIGYNFTGTISTGSCLSDGTWEYIDGMCEVVDCGPPYDIANGFIVYNATTFGSLSNVSCNIGYNFSDSNNAISCGSDGRWDLATGSCNALDCGTPKEVPNGYAAYNSTTFGSLSRVVCNTGYNFSGANETTSCGNNGLWGDVTGSCSVVDCRAPPEIPNANVTYLLTTYGSLTQIVCNPDFNFSGVNSSMSCGADGIWEFDRTITSCQLVDCGPPGPLPHGDIVFNATTVGSTGQIVCHDGYSLPDTTDTLSCMSDGVWETITTSCYPDVVHIDDWILVLRAEADIGQSSYATWMDDTIFNDYPIDPQKVQPGCIALTTSLPCNMHFRSKLVTNWGTSNVEMVKYILLKNNMIRQEVLFDGRGTSKTDWFSKDKVINSTWTDLKTSIFNYFSIEGHANTRHFFINHNYQSCPLDYSWTVVIDGNDNSHPCDWDNPATYPKFIYTKLSTKTMTRALEDFEYGDAMAILVKLGN